MTKSKHTVGLVALAVVAAVALGVLLFAPGIGCQGAEMSNAAKHSRNAAAARHRYESLTQYMDAKKKILRKQRYAAQKKAAADRAKASNPTSRSAFRVGVVVGIWNRFIWTPSKSGTGGKLSSGQLRNARVANQALARRLDLLKVSALEAKLPDLAAAAGQARAALGQVSVDLAGSTFTPQAITAENDLIKEIRRIAKAHGLKVMPRVPTGTL